MAALQERVQLADELVGSGRETGLQIAVYQEGDQVVDVVAGMADSTTGRPVSPDTPFYAYSVGKAMTSTIVHILAERGALGEAGYDTPIRGVLAGVHPARQGEGDHPACAHP
jgi:CubicO group peptidase (beta-lactamase class C family)